MSERPGFTHRKERHGLVGPISGRQLAVLAISVEAVALGLERTGAVVTAAAILLAVAIGSFVTSSISFIQQIGVATAAGVLIDAFIVRALLVPALMGLLGKWNWWAPMPLRRLHDRIGFSEDVSVGRKDQPELVRA